MTDAGSSTDCLRAAIDRALADGIPRRDIFAMVAAASPPPPREAVDPNGIIYEEVPSGLIALADAAEKYGLRHNTLRVAIFRGLLPTAGSVRGPNRRLRQLVPEAALRHYLWLPPDDMETATDLPQSEPRSEQLRRYNTAPEGMITFPHAVRKYNVSTGWLRYQLFLGGLEPMGYLWDQGTRSAVLLLESEVQRLASEATTEAGDA